MMKKKNKRSSDMRSVPDVKISNPISAKK